VEFEDIKFIQSPESDDPEKIKIGEINLYLGNCKRKDKIDLYYNSKSKTYGFLDLNSFMQDLCLPQFISDGDRFIGTCSDCTYYPINKKYGLKPDYTPPVKQFELQPDVFIHEAVYNDLKALYLAAKDAGHPVRINSAYRSYSDQLETFENWVLFEMSFGHNRATAELIANTYSARPGFSEHQLGTVIDIGTDQCDEFLIECLINDSFWTWLAENAHKYGFALSYPEHKEEITGYVYEP